MVVRLAKIEELEILMNIYKNARKFMEQNNNSNQWGKLWPYKKFIIENIKDKKQYVLLNNNDIAATFSLLFDGDPCYKIIENGEWLNNKEYIVIHSLASSFKYKNVFHEVVNYVLTFKKDIRVDTYKDNIVMQNAFIKEGFKYCGIIYVYNLKKSPRLAYQKIYK